MTCVFPGRAPRIAFGRTRPRPRCRRSRPSKDARWRRVWPAWPRRARFRRRWTIALARPRGDGAARPHRRRGAEARRSRHPLGRPRRRQDHPRPHASIRILAGDPELEVPSPTFTLMQSYDTPRGPVVHADFYRLGGARRARRARLGRAHRIGPSPSSNGPSGRKARSKARPPRHRARPRARPTAEARIATLDGDRRLRAAASQRLEAFRASLEAARLDRRDARADPGRRLDPRLRAAGEADAARPRS